MEKLMVSLGSRILGPHGTAGHQVVNAAGLHRSPHTLRARSATHQKQQTSHNGMLTLRNPGSQTTQHACMPGTDDQQSDRDYETGTGLKSKLPKDPPNMV